MEPQNKQEDQNLEILIALNTYQKQLEEVNLALENADEKSAHDLKELQLNLVQILELTLDQLENSKNVDKIPVPQDVKNTSSNGSKDIDSEIELFKQEILLLDQPSTSAIIADEIYENKESGILKELHALEGKQVRVPYTEKWGGFSYHNAMVFNLVTDDDGSPDLTDPKVSVLFNQPTSLSMLPCRFFLDGKCKFDVHKCKFSHGEEVSVSDLQDFIPTNKDTISENSKALVLHDLEDIWHHGSIQDILQDRSAISFNCSVCNEVSEVLIDQVVPIHVNEDEEDEDESESSETPINKFKPPSPSCEEEILCFTNNILGDSVNKSKLGHWEKYTKGIGSKLMASMGYVVGEGLGPEGKGRVDPVPAYAYPQGVSLDRCMELRLKSKGEDLYQVEKRLLKQQQINEVKQKKQQENLASRTSVFDIINNKLGGQSSSKLKNGDSPKKTKLSVHKTVLKADSAKELNRKNFRLNSKIAGLQKELRKLEDSRTRQLSDHRMVKSLTKQITEKELEISKLQDSEKRIHNEQLERKAMKRLTYF